MIRARDTSEIAHHADSTVHWRAAVLPKIVTSLMIALLVLCSDEHPVYAYSVFTHEQIIDLAWIGSIRPLLISRYPNATPAQLREAQAYAYGGCEIQDAGYYPFGQVFFSELTHYVRTGDFVASLIRNARTLDELAFALGALSHYIGDNVGHHDAVNPSTALAFPNLAQQYGPSVTYDESPHGHVRTEFAFDVDQMTKEHLAPASYLKHIGLHVSSNLLERAFYETYGLHLSQVLGNKRRTAVIRSYRYAVRSFLPAFAHAEVVLHRNSFLPDPDSDDVHTLNQRIQAAGYNSGTPMARKKPGIRTHLLAFVVIIVPKIGPASDLAIKIPTEETEAKYVASLNKTLDTYEDLVGKLLRSSTGKPETILNLENKDLDTGYSIEPGSYPLTDKTYAVLLDRITAQPAVPAPFGVKRDLLAYYSNPSAPITTKKDAKAWQRVQSELAILQTMPVVPLP